MTRPVRYLAQSRHAQIRAATLWLIAASAVAVAAAKTVSIPAQPRPLWQMARQFGQDYNWRITYEEAPLENPDDLANSATSGVHLVARPTAFNADFEEPSDPTSMEQKWAILDKLVRGYLGPHGKMAVLHNGDFSHIVPTTLKRKDGQVVPFEPMLSTRVSFQASQRSLLDTVGLIMSQVSSARGIAIGLGTIPTNLFVRQSQLAFADNEQARDVLMRIFEDANGAIQLQGGIQQRVTWTLLYDVSNAGYFFNARLADPLNIQPLTAPPGKNPPTPGGPGPGFAPPHP